MIIKQFLNPKSVRMLFLGFSSGLPILLVFSTLSVWLFKAGVNRSMVTMFSWAGLAYSFKFIWSPLVDNVKLPFNKFGHRKSWLLLSQFLIIVSLIFISINHVFWFSRFPNFIFHCLTLYLRFPQETPLTKHEVHIFTISNSRPTVKNQFQTFPHQMVPT